MSHHASPLAALYHALLSELDDWFAKARADFPGVIPCRSGCSACCHGPFDISIADILLVREGVAALPAETQSLVRERAHASAARLLKLAPDWQAPFAIADLGEDRFDAITDALAAEPCPLLDDAGNCSIYESRPLVCRMIGLGMLTDGGRTIENACPIQEDFPAYVVLPPQPFDLERFEEVEATFLEAAAAELLGTPAAAEFETTIA
ncbi:MAG: YkgJ family cysteine cluster protein, partial [Gemmatimonadota bacterium]